MDILEKYIENLVIKKNLLDSSVEAYKLDINEYLTFLESKEKDILNSNEDLFIKYFKEIENKYGEVTVEKISEPDLTQLGDTTAKIKLKFKDDSISNEITVKVKVKELPLFNFLVLPSPQMKKRYEKSDNMDLDKLNGTMYIPAVLNDGEYSTDNVGSKVLRNIEYKDFKYFGIKIVKKDTDEEVANGAKVEDILTPDGKLQLEAYCEKIYSTEYSNRVIIKYISLK